MNASTQLEKMVGLYVKDEEAGGKEGDREAQAELRTIINQVSVDDWLTMYQEYTETESRDLRWFWKDKAWYMSEKSKMVLAEAAMQVFGDLFFTDYETFSTRWKEDFGAPYLTLCAIHKYREKVLLKHPELLEAMKEAVEASAVRIEVEMEIVPSYHVGGEDIDISTWVFVNAQTGEAITSVCPGMAHIFYPERTNILFLLLLRETQANWYKKNKGHIVCVPQGTYTA